MGNLSHKKTGADTQGGGRRSNQQRFLHSLRYNSTTYKLKLNHGDIKVTQGDTGHAQASMVTEVYAHIMDEERKINAQKFEVAFYANPDMRAVEQGLNPPKEPEAGVDLQAKVN